MNKYEGSNSDQGRRQKSYDFHRDLQRGEQFEHKFINHLVSKGIPSEWLSSSEGYNPDYDVQIQYPSGQKVLFEIKRDYHFARTRNLLIELWSNVEGKGKGWWLQTKAEWLIVFYSDNEFCSVRMDEISHFIQSGCKWASKEISQYNAKEGYHTRFLLLNVDQEWQDDILIGKEWQKRTNKLKMNYESVTG